MPSLKKPANLNPGDLVQIIAPAGSVPLKDIQSGLNLLESWGLRVAVGTTSSAERYFSASDEVRFSELQHALDHKDTKAIIAARGGYGTTRILDRLDFSSFKKHPKWLVGFSDITALHLAINQCGFQSIHGPMPRTFGCSNSKESIESLKNILFGKKIFYQHTGQQNTRTGIVKAKLVGGNLCMLAHCIGSKYALNTKNSILFLEDIGESPYKIDRMMVQLKRAGKLQDLVGVLIGHFSDATSDNDFGQSIFEIIKHHIPANIPVSEGVPIGHENHNWAVSCGKVVTMEVLPSETIILA